MDVQELIAELPDWEQALKEYQETKAPPMMQRASDGLDQMCAAYLEAPPADRETIRQAFAENRTLLNALIGHIYRAASRIQDVEDSQWLLVGLAAASIEDQRTDFRDVLVALGELYMAAARAGIDNRSHFKTVAALSTGKAKGGRNTRSLIGGFRQSAHFKQSVAPRLEFIGGAAGLSRHLPTITSENASQLTPLSGIAFPPGGINQGMAWSPNGSYLARAQGSTVQLYAVEDLHAGPRILGGGDQIVKGVAFAPDGHELVSTSGKSDSDIAVWDVASGDQLRAIGGQHPVHSLAVSAQGDLLASGGRDGIIRLWSMESGAEVGILQGHRLPVLNLRFSPDDSVLVSCDNDLVAYLWDLGNHSLRAKLAGDKKRCMLSTSFHRDGSTLVTAGRGPRVRLWDVQTGDLIEELEISKAHDVNSAAFSPDGTLLATGGTDRRVQVWDFVARRRLARLKSHKSGIQQVLFNPTGTVLASASVYEGVVRFWGANTAEGSGKR